MPVTACSTEHVDGWFVGTCGSLTVIVLLYIILCIPNIYLLVCSLYSYLNLSHGLPEDHHHHHFITQHDDRIIGTCGLCIDNDDDDLQGAQEFCKIAYVGMLSDNSRWTCYVEIVNVNRVFTVYLSMCHNCIYIINDKVQFIETNRTALFVS